MFKDQFSKQANIYSRYRPHYPSELFQFLASLTPQHDLVWDCGTGNGQAAIGLSQHYNQVFATDPSSSQIAFSTAKENIKYEVEPAESCSLTEHSADIVTIANAMHWFDFDRFYAEVRRVVKPGGIIAAWAYALPTIAPEMDHMVSYLHNEVLNDYWRYENRLVEHHYKDIPFPFSEISAPQFHFEKKMTLEDILGYLNTWSAVQRYIEKNKSNPVEELPAKFPDLFRNSTQLYTATWRFILKVGRLN